ncbi:Gfo/Idh/MocA family oxidoreductase [Burkholderia oklahomensis]|uniref:Gfo/Idh/MocA family oxidoreductase n=1 Tax=Burkholderia oklahomensis TaxID=342113 RepID=UPI00265021D6|nr:Gfo/Idh/MocA family oxidoreductase [Burkholderia oklahomensis]MDN7670984.1 Gfo/Idh/MocA family oxidoreductase [Burkholderia oklahomensis]
MKPLNARNRRVLVAGAKFGEIYLNAFLAPQPGLELAGLLANGSPRARQLAHAFGIPLYTSIDDVPGDIDIACVVVRSTVVGGAGTSLAQAFLERGAHVVQEHPLHPDDVARLQQLAARRERAYWVNSFYAHTPAGRCWIDRARRVRRALDDEHAHFAHLATSRQLLYSSLDLLLQASSAVDATVDAAEDDDPAFRSLRVGLPGCRATLRLQTYLDPDDPDLHSLAMHQLTLGWPSGYLSLDASYGPVVWTAALYDPQHRDGNRSAYRTTGAESAHLDRPPVLPLHPAPTSWRDALEVDGPAGVAHVLHALRRHLDGTAAPAAFDPAYQLALARVWQKTLQCAGPARERRVAPPPAIDPRTLIDAAPDEQVAA